MKDNLRETEISYSFININETQIQSSRHILF